MEQNVKILFYGNDNEIQSVGELFRKSEALSGSMQHHYSVDDAEEFERVLIDWEPTLIVILFHGAKGMEGAYRARERRPCLPVFWFSDDRDFGMQSYRLNCAYFSTKPITLEKINSAIQRCRHVGIQVGVS